MQFITDFSSRSPIIYSIVLSFVLVFLAKIIHLFFDRWIKKITEKTKTEFDDALIEMLEMPIFWTVIFIGLYFGVFPFFLNSFILSFLKNVLFSLLLIIWTLSSIKISELILNNLEGKFEKRDKSTLAGFIPFIRNIVKIIIVSAFFITALNIWGVDITPFIASAGVAGVAIAFAAKDTVANLFGGVSIFFDKPYQVGDYILINDKYRGEVTEVGMRSTRIKTRDNILITVPNSVMVTDVVVNETGFDPRLRIRIPLNVSYESDLDHVEKILLEIFKKNNKILQKPSPRVRFRRFAASSIELEVMGVIAKPAERGRITHELIKKIHEVFSNESINMPFPQREVYVHKTKN